MRTGERTSGGLDVFSIAEEERPAAAGPPRLKFPRAAVWGAVGGLALVAAGLMLSDGPVQEPPVSGTAYQFLDSNGGTAAWFWDDTSTLPDAELATHIGQLFVVPASSSAIDDGAIMLEDEWHCRWRDDSDAVPAGLEDAVVLCESEQCPGDECSHTTTWITRP